MGSFSWTRADCSTIRANLTDGDSYKILVPAEFGGGYIKDEYYDYGYVFNNPKSFYIDAKKEKHFASEFPVNDLYGILAYWNECGGLEWKNGGVIPPCTMYGILRYGMTKDDCNRGKGIQIGCYDNQIDRLKYPLKLVSASCNMTYEECPSRSYGDPNQGFYRAYWTDSDYIEYKYRIKMAVCPSG